METMEAIKITLMKNNNNKSYLSQSLAAWSFIPFMNMNIFTVPDSLSGFNKLIFSTLIFSVIILWCIINIIGYFGSLYILKYTDLETKYPKLKPVFNYYVKTSTVFLIIEIIFVLFTLLLIIGICLHILYIANYT